MFMQICTMSGKKKNPLITHFRFCRPISDIQPLIFAEEERNKLKHI